MSIAAVMLIEHQIQIEHCPGLAVWSRCGSKTAGAFELGCKQFTYQRVRDCDDGQGAQYECCLKTKGHAATETPEKGGGEPRIGRTKTIIR